MSIKALAQLSIGTDDQEEAEGTLRLLRAQLMDELGLMAVGGVRVQLDEIDLEPSVSWVTMGPDPYLVTCRRCGKGEPKPELPCSVNSLVAYMRYLMVRHEDCREVPA